MDALRAMHHELERRFEGALRREREESRTLVEALSDGVLAADRRGVVVLDQRRRAPAPGL